MSGDMKIGISAAASWAWGTSLVVGMQIAREKGLAAWAIWATANSLTLALFGELARRGIVGRRVWDARPAKCAALLVQCFCLVIQMNIIFEVLRGMGMGAWTAYGAASGVGVAFTLGMYRHGLSTSVWTDVWQWGLTMTAILAIIGMGLYTGAPRVVFPESSASDVLWGMWSACILFAGPIGDVQHWQRAEAAGQSRAYLAGAALFALYMALILVMARFEFTPAMNALLLAAVFCVTTSTIDSIAVALHELRDRRAGTAAALGICLFWGIFVQIGVLDLWSYAGAYRVAFALSILALAWRMREREAE